MQEKETGMLRKVLSVQRLLKRFKEAQEALTAVLSDFIPLLDNISTKG